jgi:probable rRNA maturation factor
MTLRVHVQYALPRQDLPGLSEIKRWVKQALEGQCSEAEITVRIVDNGESEKLNLAYRQRSGPTNVLSFRFVPPAQELPAKNVQNYLGDVVVCAPVVTHEAHAQHKELTAHWAHMVVHGSLHLLGYDHLDDDQALAMEALEVATLARMGYPNPYHAVKTL